MMGGKVLHPFPWNDDTALPLMFVSDLKLSIDFILYSQINSTKNKILVLLYVIFEFNSPDLNNDLSED